MGTDRAYARVSAANFGQTALRCAGLHVFCIYYFALPVLVGWAPEMIRTKVAGPVNVAYLFAQSQFFVAWITVIVYVRAAGRFDRMVKSLLERLK